MRNTLKERLLNSEQLKEICPFGRSTIWRWEKAGIFPKRRQILPGGRVGWLASEVENFIAKLPTAGKYEGKK